MEIVFIANVAASDKTTSPFAVFRHQRASRCNPGTELKGNVHDK
jgi:hypothetical protein